MVDIARTAPSVDEWMTDDEVVAATKGRVSKANLAQRRYKRLPPTFHKPTPRAVLYRRADVEAWLAGSAQASEPATGN